MMIFRGYEKLSASSRCSSRASAAFIPVSSAGGMTLIELLVVLVLLVIMTATMIGGLAEWRASLNRREVRSILAFDVKRMRSEAAGRGSRIILSIAASGTEYDIGVDYAPFSDPPAGDELLYKRVLPANITAFSAQTIMFDPRGFQIDSSGEPASSSVTFSEHSVQFCSTQIYPTGYMVEGS